MSLNNGKKDMILFHWCRKINIYILKTLSFRVGGGQDKLAWTAYPPGVKIIRVGGKITQEILPPRGASCPGGQDKLLHRFVSNQVRNPFDGSLPQRLTCMHWKLIIILIRHLFD